MLTSLHNFYSIYLLLPIIYTPLIVTSSVFDIPALNFGSTVVAFYHIIGLINMLDIGKTSKQLQFAPKYILINFLYLYESIIKFTLHNVLFEIAYILYYKLVFEKYICNNSCNCDLIDKIFRSGVIMHSITCAMLSTIIFFYIYTFSKMRAKSWQKIVDISYYLSYNKYLSNHFNCMVGIDNYINEFINEWLQKDIDNMKKECNYNVEQIYKIFNDAIDIPIEDEIYHEQFEKIMHRIGYPKNDNIVEKIWNLISINGCLSKKSLYTTIWDTYCERRLFAASIYTDKKVVAWIVMFFSLFIYGLGLVFVVDVFNYEIAFGTGVDVFKMYLLIATYWFGIFAERIKFMFVMIRTRPFNINDILYFNNQIWQVKNLRITETVLQGTSYTVVPNIKLFNEGIINYTKGFVRDNITVTVPVSYGNADAKIYEFFNAYSDMHPDEICDIAVVYSKINDFTATLSCIWNYTHPVYSIPRYDEIKGSISSYIYNSIQGDIEKSLIQFLSVYGGGYNYYANKDKIH